ncbi:Gfo/Idh/MocA family oxidoreductase [Paenibacillus alginolyticus]|uniref:Gfo/Idh/MocA family protein n=1 Tax=Paenibacillus alginolyticus TaxID=59839 RepID=UPI0003F78DFD|nr:Gfo/Idh/MocA family oxidoreductase [Paenibacillus alginolyticus]MCY9665802.1 Gfo/Idh/MocA family oxidoreductase [Paenibacillus alginolyticus]
MSDQRVRWGVLSTARIAQNTMIPAIMQANNAAIIAIASQNPKVSEVVAKFSIPNFYSSYEELLEDPEVDAVYIPLPNSLHKEWVMKAADKGKHILCEKPIALSVSETKEMIEHCQRKQVILMEAFMYQFHPQHQVVKNILFSGEIGQPKLMRANFSFLIEDRAQDIRLDPKLGGGSIYDIGCYCIHSIRNILNSEPIRVYVHAPADPEFKVEMTAIAMFELDNGMMAIFDCSFDMVRRERYEIIATHGSIVVPKAYNLPEYFGGEGTIIVEKENGEERIEKVYGHEYTLEIEHFSQCVIDGVQPVYAGQNIFKNMKVIEACYESMKSGKWVVL